LKESYISDASEKTVESSIEKEIESQIRQIVVSERTLLFHSTIAKARETII